MRVELKVIQRDLGITVVLVTHDQTEALSLSDRLAVLSDAGKVEQAGTPTEVYQQPLTEFVRDFMGRTLTTAGRPSRRGDRPDAVVAATLEGRLHRHGGAPRVPGRRLPAQARSLRSVPNTWKISLDSERAGFGQYAVCGD